MFYNNITTISNSEGIISNREKIVTVYYLEIEGTCVLFRYNEF